MWWVCEHLRLCGENSMSHSYLHSHLDSQRREAVESLANSRGAVNRERAGPRGPRAGTIKGPGSNLLPKGLKGKLVIVSPHKEIMSVPGALEAEEKKTH